MNEKMKRLAWKIGIVLIVFLIIVAIGIYYTEKPENLKKEQKEYDQNIERLKTQQKTSPSPAAP